MSIVGRLFGTLVSHRSRLPRSINRLIDDVAKNPDGRAARLADALLGGSRSRNVPPPTARPDSEIRVFIGPTNYAAQGYLWARALQAHDARVGARNLEVRLPGGFGFPADTRVPLAVYNRSEAWQSVEFAAVSQFTHVLFEAERPIFGSLFGRNVAHEAAKLAEVGLSCAFIAHGTDVRSPRTHVSAHRWSPFADDPEQTAHVQADVDANLAVLEHLGRPVFVSTPDLLLDVPGAEWCPVVVDLSTWAQQAPVMQRDIPIVVHVPSMGSVKGTELIRPTMERLHAEGVVDYRQLSGIPSNEMPRMIAQADIVLDQFRIGSYGVAACEAMAAGRIVVGSILPSVRQKVRDATGRELPIVEADPDSLDAVIRRLAGERASSEARAAEGIEFVSDIHSGRLSAQVLRRYWIDVP